MAVGTVDLRAISTMDASISGRMWLSSSGWIAMMCGERFSSQVSTTARSIE